MLYNEVRTDLMLFFSNEGGEKRKNFLISGRYICPELTKRIITLI